jgi:hypothetical protein
MRALKNPPRLGAAFADMTFSGPPGPAFFRQTHQNAGKIAAEKTHPRVFFRKMIFVPKKF